MNFARAATRPVSTSQLADTAIERSTFPKRWSYKTTFRFGDLIPLHWEMIYPGTSLDDSHTAVLARMSTPLYPVMDNAYIDFYYFFVPMRLVWDHWKEMFGENNVNAWTQTVEYSVPTMPTGLNVTSNSYTLWDYFGLPCNLDASGEEAPLVMALPFRGYRLIWNEFYRNQNVSAPKLVNTGDVESDMTLNEVLRASRFHDYFSDALPAPQKGPDTLIPGIANTPIITGASDLSGLQSPLVFRQSDNGNFLPSGYSSAYIHGSVLFSQPGGATPPSGVALYPSNLHVSSLNAGYTISALRTAFQIQRILERDARSGTRYTEYLLGAFKTKSPDARLQRPEFLGTSRMSLNISQVLQTSSTDTTSPLGQTGAYSKTAHNFRVPRHGFTEHGMLFVLATARTERSYQNRIDRKWTCFKRFDFYDPALAHISEQPVYTRELSYQGTGAGASYDQVFGYQEAWQYLRCNQDVFTSSFRSNATGSLDSWHYGDVYDEPPTLSEGWMLEGSENVQRTLAVQDASPYDQILMDVYFDWKITAPIPIHSIPGAVDHF
ncbi:major capsid protein [Microvirus mar31]|uniref:Major capsid protein n=1 Tax=Microvirus mar31 TaxID=2851165 RepID=A0A8F5RCQ7_9VIRU|nr:major capsid protein [Microvirus mar31]